MRNDVPSNEGLRILDIYPVYLLPFFQQSIYMFPTVAFVVFSDYLKTRIYI